MRDAEEVFRALGLPCLAAPGEAEAMCAQLCACEAVDAVWSSDADALVFGATRLYRHLSLSSVHKEKELRRIDLAALRDWLGVTEGPAEEALECLWVLAGCDYCLSGAEKLGAKGTHRLLRCLLLPTPRGGRTAAGLAQHLQRRMASPDAAHDAALLLQSKQCSGCPTCGHERHGRSACAHPACASAPAQSARCAPLRAGGACECAWHRAETERFVARSLEKAMDTPGFSAQFAARVGAFRSERARARAAALAAQAAAGGGKLAPSARPSLQALAPLFASLGPDAGWAADKVHSKALPALLQWDASHPGGPAAPGALRVARVAGACKTGASLGVSSCHAFRVEWAASGGAADAEAQRSLQLMADKPELRTLRASLLRSHAAELLAEFELRPAKGGKAAGGKKAGKVAAADAQQPRINALFPAIAAPAPRRSASSECTSGRSARSSGSGDGDGGGGGGCESVRAGAAAGGAESDGGDSSSSDLPPGLPGLPPVGRRAPSAQQDCKRGSPAKAKAATPPKKPKAAAQPPQGRRDSMQTPQQAGIARFLAPARRAETPATEAAAVAAAPPPVAPAAGLRLTSRKQLWRTEADAVGGGWRAGDGLCIDLITPPHSQPPRSEEAEDVIVLS